MRLGDFVAGGFPLPQSPIYDGARGVGDFVPGGFPLPQTPVYFPSVDGSLPKAPALTQSDLAPLPAADSPCGGMGGLGCGCASCGMGAFDMASFENLIPGQTLGISNTYLAAGALVAFLFFSMGSPKRGRR